MMSIMMEANFLTMEQLQGQLGIEPNLSNGLTATNKQLNLKSQILQR